MNENHRLWVYDSRRHQREGKAFSAFLGESFESSSAQHRRSRMERQVLALSALRKPPLRCLLFKAKGLFSQLQFERWRTHNQTDFLQNNIGKNFFQYFQFYANSGRFQGILRMNRIWIRIYEVEGRKPKSQGTQM